MTTQTDDRLRALLAATLERFFTTKTSCDVEGAMSYFAPDLVTYTDATLGWAFDSFQELRNVFEQYMPGRKPPARSYATAILSNDVSALVHMVDTPELFGGELRILAAVDFCDGKIVRWVDYWTPSRTTSSCTRSSARLARASRVTSRTPRSRRRPRPSSSRPPLPCSRPSPPATPRRRRTCCTPTSSSSTCRCERSSSARSRPPGTSAASSQACPTASQARCATSSAAPPAEDSRWTADHGGLVGITALELDAGQLITKVTFVYDSRQLSPARRAALAGASVGQ
jgi:hypothetical protein